MAAARFIPLLKPNGKIWPIDCGTILRRMVATAIAKWITLINCGHRSPRTPSGAEEVHKLCQTFIRCNPDNAILSIDVAKLDHSEIIGANYRANATSVPMPRTNAESTTQSPKRTRRTAESPWVAL